MKDCQLAHHSIYRYFLCGELVHFLKKKCVGWGVHFYLVSLEVKDKHGSALLWSGHHQQVGL